ncbi:LysE family translocator [Alcanivorax sp. JB21]|uniref:LysE family translocator n=1 Tax=Alcanivorax limicola TaxID=2874102 RepID=UPI001CBB4807|nr:LysE family translocator [Alcanivorax limicola]MBZ2189417.1 LysE family translocator [Alcanivorax limicola]
MTDALPWSALISLTAAMVILAALPSVSVLAVTARAASHGFLHGAAAALGIVLADILFIMLAIFGLAALAGTLGEWMLLVRIAGALYLTWLAWSLWRAAGGAVASGPTDTVSLWASFSAGLFITLGDQKALLFYFGFFPAFLDLDALSWADALWVSLVALVAVGSVKLIYAALAARVGRVLGATGGRWLNRLAALMLLGVAAAVLSGL